MTETDRQQDLHGLSAVVTGGGGSGIGARAVDGLLQRGARVWVIDRNPHARPEATSIRADLSSSEGVEAAVASLPARVDILVNCVGVAGDTTTPLQTMLINFLGVKYLTERVAERMPPGSAVGTIASRGGSRWPERLALWSELAATSGWDEGYTWLLAHAEAYPVGYGESKEAVAVWTMYSVVAFGARGIRHNAIMPGPTITPMYERFFTTSGKDYMERFPVPLGRSQTVEEQAEALLFLVSARAGGITGTLLYVDGGTNAGLVTGQIALPVTA